MSTILGTPTLEEEGSHIVSLVLQSKKALQQGEQLGTRANTLLNATTQNVIDVLALDAKVRWLTDAVMNQLQLAARVSKSIQEKRTYFHRQAQEWNTLRTQRTNELESILDALGNQHVPPEFHQSATDDSLFGSQHSDEEINDATPGSPILRSPTATLRSHSRTRAVEKTKSQQDRRNWKTLRDFVDDASIEDALEVIENDKLALDDILRPSEAFYETLESSIATIRDGLPELPSAPLMIDIVSNQDTRIHQIAKHLEDLTSHYDQMADALKETNTGEGLSDEDLQDMKRDTAELPAIITEIENSVEEIERSHDFLVAAKQRAEADLSCHHSTLDDLEELAEMMNTMLYEQSIIEGKFSEHLVGLQHHLQTLEHLRDQFIAYQTTFHKLLLEIARRKQYREAALTIVRGMQTQLDEMTEEELSVRAHFNTEHGSHLPEDLCLCVGNEPTRWEVASWNGLPMEELPDIESDLLHMARESLAEAAAAPASSRESESM